MLCLNAHSVTQGARAAACHRGFPCPSSSHSQDTQGCACVLALSAASLLSATRKHEGSAPSTAAVGSPLVWIALHGADSLSHLSPWHWSTWNSAPLFSSFLPFLAIQHVLIYLFIYFYFGNLFYFGQLISLKTLAENTTQGWQSPSLKFL